MDGGEVGLLLEQQPRDVVGERLRAAQQPGLRPRIYFEEWDDPQISGIRWVSELVSAAGGDDCFPELAASSLARGRIVADPAEVVRRAPDIIIGSWCGKKFNPRQVRERPESGADHRHRGDEEDDQPRPRGDREGEARHAQSSHYAPAAAFVLFQMSTRTCWASLTSPSMSAAAWRGDAGRPM